MTRDASVFDNDDQRWVEDLAQRLYEDPRARALIQDIGDNWRARMKPSAENEKLFAVELQRAAFSGFMHAAGCDPLYPKLYTFGRDARELNGHTIPASWSAHPNPDYLYRFIAVDGEGEYLIKGRIPKERPAAAEYARMWPMSRTISGANHAPSMKPAENAAATAPTPSAVVPMKLSASGVVTLRMPDAA